MNTMNALMAYLAGTAACTAVFWGIYRLFLRRETFFGLNRAYLLAASAAAFILPALPTGLVPVTAAGSTLPVVLETVVITPGKLAEAAGSNFHILSYLPWLYAAGAAIFGLRLLLQMTGILRLIVRFGVRRRSGMRVVPVGSGFAPFSFFGLVFVDHARLHEEGLETILAHERVHIRQRHSADLLALELAAAVQWFNPLAWAMIREMKTLHEYLADHGVLQSGVGLRQYRQLILDEALGLRENALANSFNVSLIQKRIAMMTKPKSRLWARTRVLIALPALLGLAVLFTAGSTAAKVLPKALTPAPAAPVVQKAEPAPAPQDKPKQKTEVKYVAPVAPEEKVYTEVEKMPGYVGGHEAMIKFLVENIKYPEEAAKKNLQGTVFVQFVVKADGTVKGPKVLRGFEKSCDAEALRVVGLMPKWVPGEQKGKAVDVMFTLPIKFALDGEKKK